MSQNSFSEDPSPGIMVNGSRHICNLVDSTFHCIYGSLTRQLSWKKFVLEIFKILRLSVNTLTVHDKYSFLSRDNLRQPIHTQLYQKQKFLLRFLIACLISLLNFEHFLKKDHSHSLFTSEIMDSEKRDYISV